MPSQFTEFPIPTEGITDTAAVTSLDSILGIKDGALKKETKANAKTDLGIAALETQVSSVKLRTWTLSANTTYTFTVSNSTKAVAFLLGANANNCGMTLINTTGAGLITKYAVYPGATSALEFTSTTNQLSIAMNANTSKVGFLIFEGDITRNS